MPRKIAVVSINNLALMHGVSFYIIKTTLCKDLGLAKKSARWGVPKLPTKEQKQERVRISQKFWDLEGGSKRRSRGDHNNE